MTGGHAQRAHAVWSASASARLWACPGSLKLSQTVDVPDRESEAAAWGTACHEVSEDCLRNSREAIEWIGRFVVTKEHKIEVDEEMAEAAQAYVDYVLSQHEDGGRLLIEQRFSLEKIRPPFEAGGTADAVLVKPIRREVEVVDLKGGRGVVVEAAGNPQLRTYALGAMLSLPGLDVQQVKVTIVQPRAPHRDGRIRSETFHVADLLEWANDLREAMARSAEACAQYEEHVPVGPLYVWVAEFLEPGAHCRFCPANGFCPALASKAEAEANVWFQDETGTAQRNTADRLQPEEIARILDNADMIQDWLNAVRAYAHAQAEGGVVIPNYVLVEKHGRETWREGVDEKVRQACAYAELDDDKYQNPPKLKTPKQIRKALGAGLQKLVENLSTTPTAGTSLVRQDKTSREAVQPVVERFFNVET